MEPRSQVNFPREFNDNDIMVFNAYITKYICQYHRFDRKDFLRALLENEFGKTNAYSREEKHNAIDDEMHVYNQLIRFCLETKTLEYTGKKILR